MKNPIKALKAIELLAGGDFAQDLEWLTYREGRKVDKRILEAAKILGNIYMIAHSEISTCRHESWEKIKLEVIKQNEPHI